jgi:uncharacterized protein
MRIAASLFVAALSVLATPANAFDCSKAASEVEKAICADPGLKSKDDAMAALYADVKALSTPDEQKMLARSQKAWIEGRESECGGQSSGDIGLCIRGQLGNRIAELSVKPASGPGTASRLIPVFVMQAGGKGLYDIDDKLMRFVNPGSPGEKLFNAAVAKIATAAPLGPQPDHKGEDNLDSSATLELTYASPKLISVQNSYGGYEGGAHPNGGTENINIDLATGKPLSFAKLFPAAANKALTKQCRAQIVKQKQDKMEGGTYDPATDDFLKDEVIAKSIGDLKRWTLKAAEAVVAFDAYEIGSYAEGDYECTFAMKDLKALALPTANLPE